MMYDKEILNLNKLTKQNKGGKYKRNQKRNRYNNVFKKVTKYRQQNKNILRQQNRQRARRYCFFACKNNTVYIQKTQRCWNNYNRRRRSIYRTSKRGKKIKRKVQRDDSKTFGKKNRYSKLFTRLRHFRRRFEGGFGSNVVRVPCCSIGWRGV